MIGQPLARRESCGFAQRIVDLRGQVDRAETVADLDAERRPAAGDADIGSGVDDAIAVQDGEMEFVADGEIDRLRAAEEHRAAVAGHRSDASQRGLLDGRRDPAAPVDHVAGAIRRVEDQRAVGQGRAGRGEGNPVSLRRRAIGRKTQGHAVVDRSQRQRFQVDGEVHRQGRLRQRRVESQSEAWNCCMNVL